MRCPSCNAKYYDGYICDDCGHNSPTIDEMKETKMKTYKVWTYIEEIDEDNDHYEDVSTPLSIGEFKTKKEAEEFREKLFNNREVRE